MEFVNAVRSLGVAKKHSKHNNDLFVDRLNHRYTVCIILMFTMVVTLSQYGGQPISCCWVSSTYNIPLNEDIPHNETDRKVKMLKYYQWTPFILLFQALLFYLPRMIWRSLNDKSGLDMQSIVDAVYDYNTDASKYSDREKLLNYLTNTFDYYVKSMNTPNKEKNKTLNSRLLLNNADAENPNLRNRNVNEKDSKNAKKIQNRKKDFSESEEEDEEEMNELLEREQPSKFRRTISNFSRLLKVLCITKGKRYGNYLLSLFVFCRILYTLNSIMQLFILNHFLGNDYLILGFEVIGKVWSGDDWTQLKRFPRVTMCDFRIREVGIVHRYTVQCVLSINLFNEKIFIFLWFWLCLVSFFNLFDLLSWVYTLVINTHDRYTYVKRRLNSLNSSSATSNNISGILSDYEERQMFKRFVNNYLREDGILALRLLSKNAHDLIVSEVVKNLYTTYSNDQKQLISSKKKTRLMQRQGGLKQEQQESNLDLENDFILDERNNSRFAPVNELDMSNKPRIHFTKQNETPLSTSTLFQKTMPASNE